ncbi:MAG TPA: pilus assembly protein PilM, partial [Candidatus Ozemobacteraceae bacterium]|nr:pilus assembly protein PilM [Candidatus Ozemobacteraceae bacterium]
RKMLTKHLTELLYDNQIQTKRAISLVSGRAVTIRYIEIPVPEKPEMLADAVQVEAAKQMPFSMENAALGYTAFPQVKREDKQLIPIMVAALQKDIVQVITDNLKGGGLSNDSLLTLPQSLELLIGESLKPPAGKDLRAAVIHCGHKTTSIMIYKNGILNFYRDINMAGETITEAILAGGEVEGEKISFANIDEVDELKHKIGVLPPDDVKALKEKKEKFVAQQIFTTVEKIFQHIQLSVSFYISQFGESALDRIYLSGGTSAMKNFKEFIGESLEVSVEIIDPMKYVPLGEVNFPKEKMENEAPAIAPALGMALYNYQPDIVNFIDILYPHRRSQSSTDFSKAGAKFTQGLSNKLGISFELDETKLRIIAVLLAIIIIAGGAYPLVKVRQNLAKTKSDFKKFNTQLEELTASNKEVTDLNAEREQLEKLAGFADELKKYSFPTSEALLELATIVPKQIFLISGEIRNESGRRIFKITGHSDNSDRVFEFLKVFATSTRFLKNPSLEATEEVPIDESRYFIRFVLNGQIVIPEPEKPAAPEGEGDSSEPAPSGE